MRTIECLFYIECSCISCKYWKMLIIDVIDIMINMMVCEGWSMEHKTADDNYFNNNNL
jgi:hypothetical protein